MHISLLQLKMTESKITKLNSNLLLRKVFSMFTRLCSGHKVLTYIYIEYHSVWPLVGIGTLPPLSLASECAPPPGTKGGGAQSPAGGGLGESHLRRLEKKLSTLPTLWFWPKKIEGRIGNVVFAFPNCNGWLVYVTHYWIVAYSRTKFTFIYRRPTLYPLEIAVDFLKSL